MTYRPQFAFAPEDGDEHFRHVFDVVSAPGLSVRLAPGEQTEYIPLPLQTDVPFIWRGVLMTGSAIFGVRFKDSDGNYLSDDYVPIADYDGSMVPGPIGSVPVPLEEISCQAGGIVYLSIKNLT